MIKFENVNVTMQGKRILSDINLEIQDGEFVLICGESGCGKTTLTKLINGLIPHFVKDVSVDGTITVCGKNVAEMPMYEIAEFVGSVFRIPELSFFIRILMLRWHLAWKTEAWNLNTYGKESKIQSRNWI